MAGSNLSGPRQQATDRDAVTDYLAAVAAQLTGPPSARAAVTDELRDGLMEALETHHARGCSPQEATAAAIAEFGDPDTVAAAFGPELGAVQARRVAVGLLATGPLVGLSWLAMALASAPAAGPRLPAGLAVGATLPAGLAVVPLLFVAVLAVAVPAAVVSVLAAGRLARWLPAGSGLAPTAAGLAAGCCVAGDLLLLSGLVAWTAISGGLVWPLAVTAATASAIRLVLAGLAARRCVAARRQVA